MQMKDISDEELKKIENSSVQKSSNREKEDQDLISMVQDIKAGKQPITEPVSPQIPVVEPEMPKAVNVNIAPTVQSSLGTAQTNANYWKINGLPSKGKFYPEGTEILGRPMKVLEVKKVSSMSEDNGDFVINDIIRKTVTGIDTNELYTADKLYIVFWLRANTYRDSGYTVPFMCPKCEKKSEYHFDCDALEVQYVNDDFIPGKDLKMVNGETITFDYLKTKDEIYIDRFKELNSQAVGAIDDELLAMSQMIKTVNGQEKTLLEKYHWITNITPGDYSFLKTYMEKKGMGLKPFVNVECKECGGTAPIGVSFREDFFIPEYKFE